MPGSTHLSPVDNVEEGLDVVGALVHVLEVVGVLPVKICMRAIRKRDVVFSRKRDVVFSTVVELGRERIAT